MSETLLKEKSVSGNKLINMELRKGRDGVLRIFLQGDSSIYAQFKADGEMTFKLGGVVCYRPRQELLRGVCGRFHMDANSFEFDGYPNLCILLAKDLTNGVEFNFGAMPISQPKLREWAENLATQVKVIFLTYVREVDIRVEVNSKVVEFESFDK